jgi:shikimate dehydrogenase
MTISGKVKICGIIGDPIEHTMSPAMHNAAFDKLGLDYVFVPFLVKKEGLRQAIDGVRGLNIRGLGVTIPHKVAVMQYLDQIDDLAQKIGAVNILVNDNGTLTGYNTDAGGFLRALLERGIEPKGKMVAILGAGGASRAISFVLAERGANLIILNRTWDKAIELAERVSRSFGNKIEALPLDKENLTKALGRADIMMNCTNVGMHPHVSETLVTADQLKSDMIVFDTVYNPIKTQLLKEAEKAGATTISGVEMLVWQGVLAFEMWTHHKAPVEVMREAVIKMLQK